MTTSIEQYQRLAAKGMSEDDLLRSVVEIALKLHYLVYHALTARTLSDWRTSMMGHIGFPDLVLTRDPYDWMSSHTARLLFVELKSSRGRVGEHQQLWLDVLRDAGAEVHIWRPIDLMDGTIVAVLSGERRTA